MKTDDPFLDPAEFTALIASLYDGGNHATADALEAHDAYQRERIASLEARLAKLAHLWKGAGLEVKQ